MFVKIARVALRTVLVYFQTCRLVTVSITADTDSSRADIDTLTTTAAARSLGCPTRERAFPSTTPTGPQQSPAARIPPMARMKAACTIIPRTAFCGMTTTAAR